MKTNNINEFTLVAYNLRKRYHHNIIFNSLNVEFRRGYCYMIIGKNGSGKSTLIKLLLNINKINGGTIYRYYKKAAYVPEKGILPTHLTVYDFLCELSKLRNIHDYETKILDELVKWEISEKKDKRISSLSKGMIQKVLLIQALLVDADLIVFDEVLNGLDPKMQKQLFDCIESYKKEDKTIIIISHYPKSYEKIVDITYEISDGEIKSVN